MVKFQFDEGIRAEEDPPLLLYFGSDRQKINMLGAKVQNYINKKERSGTSFFLCS